MKLDFDQRNPTLSITSYSPDGIVIGGETLVSPFVVCDDGIFHDCLPPAVEDLTPNHMRRLLEFDRAIILIGVGPRQLLLGDEFLHLALARNVGVEIMTTAAACRSYNVLVGENRSVLGAFYMP